MQRARAVYTRRLNRGGAAPGRAHWPRFLARDAGAPQLGGAAKLVVAADAIGGLRFLQRPLADGLAWELTPARRRARSPGVGGDASAQFGRHRCRHVT